MPGFFVLGETSPAREPGGGGGASMVSSLRFGRKLKLPSTAQIKHQLLLLWLKDQTDKETAEAAMSAETSAPRAAATTRLAPANSESGV